MEMAFKKDIAEIVSISNGEVHFYFQLFVCELGISV